MCHAFNPDQCNRLLEHVTLICSKDAQYEVCPLTVLFLSSYSALCSYKGSEEQDAQYKANSTLMPISHLCCAVLSPSLRVLQQFKLN